MRSLGAASPPWIPLVVLLGAACGDGTPAAFELPDVPESPYRPPIVLEERESPGRVHALSFSAEASSPAVGRWGCGEGGLLAWDSGPEAPPIAGVAGIEACRDVAAAADHAWVIDETSVWTIDTTTLEVRAGPVDRRGSAGAALEAIAVDDGTPDVAWVARGVDGVVSLDPELSVGTTLVDPSSDSRHVDVQDGLLAVAEARRGVRVVAPGATDGGVLVPTDGTAVSALVHPSGQVFVATVEGVDVIDVSNPLDPRRVGRVATESSAVAITAPDGDDHLLVGDWKQVRMVDVSDPARPELVGARALGPRARALVFDDRYLGTTEGLMWVGSTPREAPSVHGPGTVRFRGLTRGQRATRVVNLRNRGNATLTVWWGVSDHAGVEVPAGPWSVEPGDAVAIEVELEADSDEPRHAELHFGTDTPDVPVLTIPLEVNVPGVDVGDPGPWWREIGSDGREYGSELLVGDVGVYCYFATWCSACNEEFGGYQTLVWEAMGPEGVSVFGLGTESLPRTLGFAAQHGVDFPLVTDEATYGAIEPPPGTLYAIEVVVGRDGEVRHVGRASTAEELAAVVRSVLDE